MDWQPHLSNNEKVFVFNGTGCVIWTTFGPINPVLYRLILSLVLVVRIIILPLKRNLENLAKTSIPIYRQGYHETNSYLTPMTS